MLADTYLIREIKRGYDISIKLHAFDLMVKFNETKVFQWSRFEEESSEC